MFWKMLLFISGDDQISQLGVTFSLVPTLETYHIRGSQSLWSHAVTTDWKTGIYIPTFSGNFTLLSIVVSVSTLSEAKYKTKFCDTVHLTCLVKLVCSRPMLQLQAALCYRDSQCLLASKTKTQEAQVQRNWRKSLQDVCTYCSWMWPQRNRY